MDHLTTYYINQAGGGSLGDVVGPVYNGSPYIQHGHGIGSFLSSLFRIVKPVLIRGAKAVGRETLSAGSNILADMVTKSPDVKVKDIVSKRVTESTQKLVNKLKGAGKKRQKRNRVIKRDIFS